MKNNLPIIILSIFVIFIFCTGCVNNDNEADIKDDNKTIESNYSELKIDITSKSNFTLLLPILYNFETNQSIESLYNELEVIEGNAIFQIQNTLYGIGLSISGNGKIKMRSYLNNSDFLYYPFSMQNQIGNNIEKNGDIEYWIYLESSTNSDVDIILDFTTTHDYGGYIANIVATITNGWNIVEGESSAGGG